MKVFGCVFKCSSFSRVLEVTLCTGGYFQYPLAKSLDLFGVFLVE